MISLEDLSEDTLVDYIYEKAKTLKKYRESSKRSSQNRFNAPLWVSRAKVTTLNARMERDAEMYESIKEDLKKAISVI